MISGGSGRVGWGNDFGSNGDHARNASICSGFAPVSTLTHYHKRSCLLSDSAAYCTRKLDISGRRRSVTSEHDKNKGLYRVSACFHNIVAQRFGDGEDGEQPILSSK